MHIEENNSRIELEFRPFTADEIHVFVGWKEGRLIPDSAGDRARNETTDAKQWRRMKTCIWLGDAGDLKLIDSEIMSIERTRKCDGVLRAAPDVGIELELQEEFLSGEGICDVLRSDRGNVLVVKGENLRFSSGRRGRREGVNGPWDGRGTKVSWPLFRGFYVAPEGIEALISQTKVSGLIFAIPGVFHEDMSGIEAINNAVMTSWIIKPILLQNNDWQPSPYCILQYGYPWLLSIISIC
jgi:hypothetical protein